MKNKKDYEVKWAECVHNPENMPYKDDYGTKIQPLWAIDYIVYNIVRGKNIDRGFANTYIFNYALDYILRLIKYNKEAELLNKFGGTVDAEVFKEQANEAICLYRNS